ncbi:MAG: hypothetical protein AAGG81_06380 [Chlamydiota bacterium]
MRSTKERVAYGAAIPFASVYWLLSTTGCFPAPSFGVSIVDTLTYTPIAYIKYSRYSDKQVINHLKRQDLKNVIRQISNLLDKHQSYFFSKSQQINTETGRSHKKEFITTTLAPNQLAKDVAIQLLEIENILSSKDNFGLTHELNITNGFSSKIKKFQASPKVTSSTKISKIKLTS